MTGPRRPCLAAPDVRVTAGAAVPVGVSVADLIGVAVLGCPSVAGLHGGRFGEAATYLPGRRVTGVRVNPTGVFVHLTGTYPAPVADIDAEVRAAVRPYLAGLALTITVEDYAAGGAAHTASARAPAVTAAEPGTAPIMPEPGAAALEPSAVPPPVRASTADVTKEIL